MDSDARWRNSVYKNPKLVLGDVFSLWDVHEFSGFPKVLVVEVGSSNALVLHECYAACESHTTLP